MSDTHVALCSGGQDSTVATHVAMTEYDADIVVYLDTGTGLGDNLRFIQEYCDSQGWPLWTLRTHESYEEMVAENGYPGPSRHYLYYRNLKERQLQKLSANTQGHLHLYTGVRSKESQRRMRTVSPEDQRADGRWTWHAPIHDWTDEDCEEYIDEHEIAENDLWTELGRSGDCYCGCFGDRTELLDLEAVGYADHAEWLRGLDVPDDCPRDQQVWAGGNWTREDWAEWDDQQMTLCSSCSPALPDGGREQQ